MFYDIVLLLAVSNMILQIIPDTWQYGGSTIHKFSSIHSHPKVMKTSSLQTHNCDVLCALCFGIQEPLLCWTKFYLKLALSV